MWALLTGAPKAARWSHDRRAPVIARTVGWALIVALGTAGCGSSSTSTATKTSAALTSTTTTAASKAANVSKQVPAGVTSTGKRKLTVKDLAALPRESRAGVKPKISGFGSSVSDQLQGFANDVATFWTQQANKLSALIPATTVVIVDTTPVTCGNQTIASTEPPVYCHLTNSVLFTLSYITAHYVPIGNAAVAEVVGELYGYHVANVLGFFTLEAAGKLTQTDIYKAGVCFSGAWLYTVYERNQFQPADLQALGNLFATYAGNGTTQADWLAAFESGFQTGDPTKCIPAAAAPPKL